MGGGANPFIQKYVKSITAVNHSILALSEVHQPAAARYCAYNVYAAVSQNDYSITGTAGHSISGATDVSTRFSNTRYFFRAASNEISSPLRFPDLQHPEVAQYAHWLPASGCFCFFRLPDRNSFSASASFTGLCRSTSETPLPAITG